MFNRLKKTRDSVSSPAGTPKAPRLGTKKLPDVGSSTPAPVLPSARADIAQPKPIRAQRPRMPSVDEGYCTSPEASTITSSTSTANRRRPSDASSTTTSAEGPPAPSKPKGILKKDTPLIRPRPLRAHELDGYASSPEKPSRYPSVPPRGDPRATRPPNRPSPLGIMPPVSLHWKLLPYNHQISKARVIFDISQRVEDIRLLYTYPPRPLTTIERNKPAANPALQDMVIRCDELPEWPIYVSRPAGIRCVDVFEAINDACSLVLTQPEKRTHGPRVRECQDFFEERCRSMKSDAEKAKGMRRVDLLRGKTYFQGMDWTPPEKQYPDGSWMLKLGYQTNYGR